MFLTRNDHELQIDEMNAYEFGVIRKIEIAAQQVYLAVHQRRQVSLHHTSPEIDLNLRALALHETPNDSSTFNLTFGNARTIRELAGIVHDLLPKARLEERPRAVEKPIRGTLSTKRAKSILGFEPRWHVKDGYRRYCEWYINEWDRAQHGITGHEIRITEPA